ncbi:ribonucleoside-diphosphate reductase, alpha chain [Terrihabitans soli]|uniref:Ribonucleoside-diphosphate reductase, alpha chain n=1 Tax=Terrihabitans soli TaxID=708113 RepID=A0A6S6QRR8_9HYPH|nr:hypothetical protein [Terrihabitans soli]BCJ91749.1 ribonucleoside-diphosphate reductase, alpha chain [Terrihabitans soli]
MTISEDLQKMRADYAYLNEDSLKTLSRGYLAEGIPDSELKAAAILRSQEIVNTAEKILGRPLPAVRLGIRRGWVSPASPVWANFGLPRGLPISCNNSHFDDTTASIIFKTAEIGMMTKFGAGTSAWLGELRPEGSPITGGGKSLGPLHFARLIQEQVGVISQANTRRGNAAIYLGIRHPDIHEWLKIKDKGHPIEHLSFGVCIDDEWMEEFLAEGKGGEKRLLMAKIVTKRRAKGYPYIFFSGNANKARPDVLKRLGIEIKATNLCTEIMLPSTTDESFVCDLSSVNLLYYDEWKDTRLVEEMVYLLDAVMTEYVEKIENLDDAQARLLMNSPLKFAKRWRAVGLGTLGYHSMLQSKMIPFESEEARALNIEVHKLVGERSVAASREMAVIYGEPEGMKGTGLRHLCVNAIAPTRSSSVILGQVSQGIEPITGNVFENDNAKGVFTDTNQILKAFLFSRGLDTTKVWEEILRAGGSVQNLCYLTDDEKAVFKTFIEIDQKEVIRQAADRQPFVDQGQSLNLTIAPTVSMRDNVDLIVTAWKLGVKSLYYHNGLNKAQELAREMSSCQACEA